MTEVRLGLRTSSTGGVDHCLLDHSVVTKTASSTPSPLRFRRTCRRILGEEGVVAQSQAWERSTAVLMVVSLHLYKVAGT